jgi:hypothetical protein
MSEIFLEIDVIVTLGGGGHDVKPLHLYGETLECYYIRDIKGVGSGPSVIMTLILCRIEPTKAKSVIETPLVRPKVLNTLANH